MNDIKVSKNVCIDYIPEERNLCESCIFYAKCPFDYICPTMDRLIEFEQEHGEL